MPKSTACGVCGISGLLGNVERDQVATENFLPGLAMSAIDADESLLDPVCCMRLRE